MKASGYLPSLVELTETPFYPQTAYQCGPAALATVLQFHGVNATPETLSRQTYLPGRKGSLQIEMTAAARRHSLLAYPLAPQLLDLLTEVAAGNPVLVFQNLSFDWYPQWHYAVVVGYDITRDEIILRSGTSKRWVTPFEVFERTWQRADFWALVILPVGDIPATATPQTYLTAAYDLEASGHPALARRAYLSASKRWPEVADAWMMQGNMAFQDHDWTAAINAFHTATRLAPASVTGWNNLAYALKAAGCDMQATQALQCAMDISPADANLQNSWRDLQAQVARGDKLECPTIQCE